MGPWPLFHRMGEHDTTEQSALDRVAANISYMVKWFGYELDDSARRMRSANPYMFFQGLQDPRFKAYCQEQDRKEEYTGPFWDDSQGYWRLIG